jgi:hypothetical protein
MSGIKRDQQQASDKQSQAQAIASHYVPFFLVEIEFHARMIRI